MVTKLEALQKIQNTKSLNEFYITINEIMDWYGDNEVSTLLREKYNTLEYTRCEVMELINRIMPEEASDDLTKRIRKDMIKKLTNHANYKG